MANFYPPKDEPGVILPTLLMFTKKKKNESKETNQQGLLPLSILSVAHSV